jgi:hypothetical protein
MFDFDADVGLTLDLRTTLRIRRITKAEKFSSYLVNDKTEEGRGFGGGNEGRLFFVADCLNIGNPKYELDRLTTLLLLFKKETEGDVLPTFSTEFGGQGTDLQSLPQIERDEVDTGHSEYPRYFLHASDIEPFKVFWAKHTQVVWQPNLMIASRRLMRMQARVGRDSDEDRLIDIMIGFEALLLSKSDDNKGPLIARRAAKLLGKNVERELRLAYECRNDLVHEGQVNGTLLAEIGMRFERYVVQVESILRSTMLRYIELVNQGLSKNRILEQIESSGQSTGES